MSLYEKILAGLDDNTVSLTTFQSQYTAGDLKAKVSHYEDLLRPMNIAGKRVALLVPVLSEFIPLCLAVNKLSGIIAPLSTQLRQEDLRSILQFLDPHIVFSVNKQAGFSFEDLVTSWASSVHGQTDIYLSDDCQTWELHTRDGESKSYESNLGGIISFSSGSTGTPKGIFFHEDSVDYGYFTMLDTYKYAQGDNVFVLSSTSTMFALWNMHSVIKVGANLVVADDFDVLKIVNLMKKSSCNKFTTTPSIFKTVYTFASKLDSSVLDNLDQVGVAGEKVPSNFVDSLPLLSNCSFVTLYGSSESCSLGKALLRGDDSAIEYEALSGVHVKSVDGELYAHTPGGFLEYFRNLEVTEESIDNGWFKLGDIVEFTGERTFKVIGRKKDIIKKGGQQVVPNELEQLLTKLSGVKAVAIVGAPHDVYGEQIVAFVVSDTLSSSDIRTFCQGKVSSYKVPDRIEFIDEIPLTQGKMDKPKLRSLLVKEA